MYTLDANIFARDLDPRSSGYADCHTLLERIDQAGLSIVSPLLVLVEVAATISRIQRDPIRGRIAVDAIRALPNRTFLPLDQRLADEAIEIAADYALRGADDIYVAVARQTGSKLVTLDGEIRTRAAKVVSVLTPAEAIAEL